MTTVPLGWIAAPFTDVFDIQGGTQPPKSTFLYAPAPNLVRLLQIRDFGERPVPTFIPNRPSLKACRRDDILIGRYGASVGRICTGINGAYNVALAKVIVPDGVDRRFVFWLLKSPLFQRPILQIERSAQNGFNKNDLSAIPISFPPFPEQQRIVTKLEDVFVHFNSVRNHLSRVPAILNRFRQTVLAAACSGKLTDDWRNKNLLRTDVPPADLIDTGARLKQLPQEAEFPEEWKVSTLDKVVTRVEAGKNIRCLERPPRVGEKGIVKISAVTWGEFRENESKTLDDATLFMPQREIRDGDLLISRANTIDLVGASVLVRNIRMKLMLSDKILRLEAPQRWKPWILMCLRSRLGRYQIENLATGNQLSMRNITQKSVRSIVIPIPSAKERDEVIGRADQLLRLADAVETKVSIASSRADSLIQSVLAKAFRGELVPTEAELARREGREYEPAAVLLERIKREREMKATAPAKRSRKRWQTRIASAAAPA